MKKLLLLIIIGIYSPMYFSQSPVWIADVDNGGYQGSTGFYGYYNYSRVQHIYKSNELNAGKISSVSLYIGDYTNGKKNGVLDNLSVKMTHVTYNAFASATYEETNLATVWEGSIDPNALTGWIRLDLKTPFDYNGTDNLLIEFRSEDGSYNGNPDALWAYTPQTTSGEEYKTVKGYSDINNPPTNQIQSTYRADVIIGYAQDNLVNGTELIGTNDANYNKSNFANGYYSYSHVQNIYTASELHTGTINQLSVYIGNYFDEINYGKIENVTLELGHTTQSSYVTATYLTGLTQTWTGDIIPNEDGWMTINFDTPFVYNGTDNLVVDMYSNDGDWSDNGAPEFAYTVQGTNTTVKDYGDVLPLTTEYLSSWRTDMIFGYESDLTIADEITIGNFESRNQFNVADGYYGYSKMQYIYEASELQQGDISRLGFYVGNYYTEATYGEIENVSVLLGHITSNEFATAAYANDTIFDTVWVGNLIPHDNGWHNIDLDTPFSYNGTDNLIIEIHSNDGDWSDNPIPEFSYTTQTTNPYKAVKDYTDVLPFNTVYRSTQRADLKVGFAPFETTVTTTDVVNGTLGTIDLNITGGKAPYQIFWDNDSYLTEAQFDINKQVKVDILTEAGIDLSILNELTYPNYKAQFTTTSKTNVKPGKYRVYIYDDEGALTYKEIGISSNFVVEQNVGLDINGLQISKSTGVDGWDDYFTSSSIGGPDDNAWYKIEVDNDVSTFVTGFKDLDVTPNAMPYDDIAYGFKVVNNSLSVVEGEVETAMGTVTMGDLLSIEKQAKTIKYFKNGVLLREVSGADNIYQLKGHIYTKTLAFLIRLKPLLLIPVIKNVEITHLTCGQVNTGAIDLDIQSRPFAGPLTVQWTGPSPFVPVNTEDVSDLVPGAYTVSATNNLGTATKVIWIGYKSVWEDKQEILCQPVPNENSLYPSSGSGGIWGTSTSNNLLKEDEPGWQQYELNNIGNGFDIGWVEVSLSNETGDFGKVFTITEANNNVSLGAYVENQGTNTWTYDFMQENFSAFRIERDDNDVITYTGLSNVNSNSYSSVIGSYSITGDVNVKVKMYSYDMNGTESIIELNNAISSFPCVIPPQYVEPLRKLDGNYYIAEKGNLFIKYQEKYNYGDLDFKIYDKTGDPILDSQQFSNSKHFGANWYKWDLNQFQGFVYEEFYTLEIKNDKGQLEYLRFKFWDVAP